VPIILNNNPCEDVELFVWEINENEFELISKLNGTEFLTKIKNPIVRKQKLAVRVLLEQLNYKSEITYSPNGKPLLKAKNIGISHSSQYVSVILSSKYNVAVDIETKLEQTWKLRCKYMTKHELSVIKTSLQSCLVWSAKECYVKLHDNPAIEFKALSTELLSSNKIRVTNSTGNVELYNYNITDNYVLVWAIEAYS
jgi:phosphopantetheinyl transferase